MLSGCTSDEKGGILSPAQLERNRIHFYDGGEDAIRLIQAVIFNLDGVLAQSDVCHYEAWRQMTREQGIPFSEEIYRKISGMRRMDALRALLRRAERPYAPGEMWALAMRKNDLFNEMAAQLGPDSVCPGALDALRRLRDMGLKTAVASCSENAGNIVRALRLDPLLDAVIDGSQLMNGKPDPEAFLLAARKLTTSTGDCLAVENTLAGVEAAREAGMHLLALGFAAEESETGVRADSLVEIDLPQMIEAGEI